MKLNQLLLLADLRGSLLAGPNGTTCTLADHFPTLYRSYCQLHLLGMTSANLAFHLLAFGGNQAGLEVNLLAIA